MNTRIVLARRPVDNVGAPRSRPRCANMGARFAVCGMISSYNERVAPWLRSGVLQYHEEIVDGIENAPEALIVMARGEAIGKRLVRVTAE